MTPKTETDRSLAALMIILIATNAWFLPHILSHLG
jgi:hypothetical protein